MGRDIDAVLTAVVPAAEPLVVADWGAIRGETIGLGRVQLSAQLLGVPSEFLVVGITTRTVILVPVSLRRTVAARVWHRRLQPRLEAAELLPRVEVIVERAAPEWRGGVVAVAVRFVRRDGSACLVELYDDPVGWAALAY